MQSIRRQSIPEPSLFRLILEFLFSDEKRIEELEPIGDKEFYSILAMLITGIVLLAVTIGPFSLV
jgi:hypothetical protein